MTEPEIAEAVAEIAARPPGEWAALLDARFPGDPELVRQATIWLTAGHALAPEAAAPSLGEHDERYELDRLLDTGATASVWLAYDRKLARNVAIKLFRAERSPALDALFAEARAACDIISDHVVRVLDVYAGDVPCIVMELVGEHDPDRGVLEPGTSAASCRPRDLTEAVRWVRGVALGVRDAHLRNVFHRDLKPHNVLITPFSRSAKIADFGLATRAAGATSPSGRHAAGTPGYLAPEQASGLTHALDPRDPADRAVVVGKDLLGHGAKADDLIGGAPPWRYTGEVEA
ncbi:MAG: serine/threonine-protein kinase, partial [Kofleriaceae bacterium]